MPIATVAMYGGVKTRTEDDRLAEAITEDVSLDMVRQFCLSNILFM